MHAASSSSSSRTQPGGVARAPIVLHRGRAGQFLHLLLLPRPSFVSQTEPIRRPTDRFGSIFDQFFLSFFHSFWKGPITTERRGDFPISFRDLFAGCSIISTSFSSHNKTKWIEQLGIWEKEHEATFTASHVSKRFGHKRCRVRRQSRRPRNTRTPKDPGRLHMFIGGKIWIWKGRRRLERARTRQRQAASR